MKKVIVVLMAAVVLASCGSSTKLINSATYAKPSATMVVTPVQADLEVSPKKISYYLEVKDNIRLGGYDNIVATAVKEALDVNGGDVLVGLETQVKYDDKGNIISINITGFPAKYVNFRKCENPELFKGKEPEGEKAGLFPVVNKKKK